MKILYVMRYTQKDETSSADDFFVNLSSKGEEDANIIAQKLLSKNVKPDLIVSSPSLRTETTSMILSKKDVKWASKSSFTRTSQAQERSPSGTNVRWINSSKTVSLLETKQCFRRA